MVAFLIILSWTVQAMMWFIDIILRIMLWMFAMMVTAVIWSFRKIQERQRHGSA